MGILGINKGLARSKASSASGMVRAHIRAGRKVRAYVRGGRANTGKPVNRRTALRMENQAMYNKSNDAIRKMKSQPNSLQRARYAPGATMGQMRKALANVEARKGKGREYKRADIDRLRKLRDSRK